MATFNGTEAPDSFDGGSEDDTAHGNGGDDGLNGNGGSDVLAGNAGSDSLDGGDDDDWLYGAERSPAFSRPYFDEFNVPYTAPVLDTGAEFDSLSGGGGDDRLFAGYGDDVDGGSDAFTGDYLYISFLGAPTGVIFDFRLPSQIIGGGTIANVENLAWVQGSEFDDSLNLAGQAAGSSDRTIVFAMGGDDEIIAGLHTGFIDAGDGNDFIDARLSDQLGSVRGGGGDDVIYDSELSSGEVLGGDGNDFINAYGHSWGGSGNDTIVLLGTAHRSARGEAGNDDITANDAGGWISGGAGADMLRGGAGDDSIASGEFQPASYAPDYDSGTERDSVTAGDGDDRVSIGYGDDADGGTGFDLLRLSVAGSTTGVILNTANIISGQAYVLGGGTISNFERVEYLQGSAFADTFNIATQAGNAAFGGQVRVDGGDGGDQVRSNGSQVEFFGGNGNDTFFSGTAADLFNGGEGNDTVDYGSYMTGVTATLTPPIGAFQGRGPDGDVLGQVENISGSNQADNLTGDGQGNVLNGRGGNDVLEGRGGDDTLDGGSGGDTMRGGTGNDIYHVDDGADSIEESAGQGTDEVRTGLAVYSLAALPNVENLTGTAATGQTLTGNALSNVVRGGSGGDRIRLDSGGDDFVFAGAGQDGVFFGAALTSADQADGGADRDQLSIQGDYKTAPLVLGAGIVNFESFVLLSGTDTRYGDSGTHSYSYDITSRDENVAAGQLLVVDGAQLQAGESFSFDGSAETDGAFRLWGGFGVDDLTGGALSDQFYFSSGRFGAGDRVDGGGSRDQLGLRGDYRIVFGAGQIASVENIVLLSGRDVRDDTDYDYDLTMNDSNLAQGVQMTVDAGQLRAAEHLAFDGSAELDGTFRIFGGAGADSLAGSAGGDIIFGALGKDYLKGGGGADVYSYRGATDSSSTGYDTIDGFEFGTDLLDLPGVHDSYEALNGGALSGSTFDSDLAQAMAPVLGSGEAVLFTASSGDLAGRLFLIVDQNGSAGYQAGQDFVIELANTAPPTTIPDFIV